MSIDFHMSPSIVSIYLTLIIILLMIAYAGVEGTMRVFTYLDLTLRYQVVKIQMRWMKWKLEKQLGFPHKNYDKSQEEY